ERRAGANDGRVAADVDVDVAHPAHVDNEVALHRVSGDAVPAGANAEAPPLATRPIKTQTHVVGTFTECNEIRALVDGGVRYLSGLIVERVVWPHELATKSSLHFRSVPRRDIEPGKHLRQFSERA